MDNLFAFIGKVTQNNGGKKIHMRLNLSSRLDYFSGHFPADPILPGVAQLDLAIEAAEKYLALDKTQVTGISQIKFTKIIRPDYMLDLQLELTNTALSFEFLYLDMVCCKGKIILTEVSK